MFSMKTLPNLQEKHSEIDFKEERHLFVQNKQQTQ
ncbi:unnamed protein product [Paramecium sonneborni]|uniref:Uncharacterized protein n=1 Tax=Paramecium sonneborni TaxID=65129 RepID=A0A8S1Q477_9CILI|nr:unnamed protein product [Paramecium sonneborni]